MKRVVLLLIGILLTSAINAQNLAMDNETLILLQKNGVELSKLIGKVNIEIKDSTFFGPKKNGSPSLVKLKNGKTISYIELVIEKNAYINQLESTITYLYGLINNSDPQSIDILKKELTRAYLSIK